MNNQQVAKYYALLGEAVEDKYLEPDMDEDIDDMSIHLGNVLAGHTVLELGCGTGFWTEVAAESAASVLAVGINASLVDDARGRAHRGGQELPVGQRAAQAPGDGRQGDQDRADRVFLDPDLPPEIRP